MIWRTKSARFYRFSGEFAVVGTDVTFFTVYSVQFSFKCQCIVDVCTMMPNSSVSCCLIPSFCTGCSLQSFSRFDRRVRKSIWCFSAHPSSSVPTLLRSCESSVVQFGYSLRWLQLLRSSLLLFQLCRLSASLRFRQSSYNFHEVCLSIHLS